MNSIWAGTVGMVYVPRGWALGLKAGGEDAQEQEGEEEEISPCVKA